MTDHLNRDAALEAYNSVSKRRDISEAGEIN